jgi:hypothetical protein
MDLFRGYSKHARSRLQQRAISARVIDLIWTYGRVERRGGADVYQIDAAGWRRMCACEDWREINALARKLSAYVVVSDEGWVLTTAFPKRRRRRARTAWPALQH